MICAHIEIIRPGITKSIVQSKAKNPKLSYTVGKDSFGAYLISKLPQKLVNKLVKLGLKIRMKKIEAQL